ncbi:hypothetical protein N7517_009965 [Penicillium concentricum]|uniref:Ankyrin n=1 Tax=Penicillium concentricum TaxID=293559 RepID=A0A9W9UXZ8_9EURO|nr:uncharacterized protein N7517_009965 [Penicillium concentricum]KAJ5360774.1 hypothetical protein N7517_009965 [Penicillium concentricum]
METDHQELPDNCNKHEPDVNTADQIQQPALDQEIRLERAKIVEELLHNHPQFNHVDLQRPALIVSAFDKPDILRLLRNADADINTPDQVGWSLILYAAKFGSVQAIQILLASGADLHTRDNYGRTPIFVAVEYERDQKILQALVEGGANLMDTSTDTGDGLLHLAVLRAPRVMRFLLQFKEQLDLNQRNFEGCTPLLCAKDEGDIRSLALLVEAGADINLVDSRGETSLHCAIEFETVNFRDLLLSQPEIELNCVSVYLGSPLHSACRRSHPDCVNALLARGADPNLISPSTWDQTPLISALLPSEYVRGDIMSSVENVVRYLVRSGASVGTIVPATFYCPLATACFSGTPSMIDFLLDAGASAGCIDPVSGRLPIHFAAANGMKNFDTILLAFQDNMMTPDAYGKNCLQWAAQYGNAYIVEYILSRLELTSERRQAVEQADCDGWTPLCWAICPLFNHYLDQMGSEHRDRVNTVRILLAHGADPEVKCRRGTKTLKPLELAQMCNAGPEIISLLQERVSPQPDLGAPSILKRGRNCVHNSDLLHDGQSHVINLRPGIAEYEELKNMVSNDRHTGVERGPNQLSHSEATVWKAYGDELKEMGWNALDPAGF